ncbi:MAG: glycosyltransferase family 4 protein, partial [Solirubrobacterales bacterium]|nr:glycosyltransferase family 4 protein [Solirubrobacterales bacterium]
MFYLPMVSNVFSQGDGPTPGGAEMQIWMLARGFARWGARVAVVVTDTPAGLPSCVEGVDLVVRAPWKSGGGIRGKIGEVTALWRALASFEAEVVVQRGASLWTGLVGTMTRLQRRRFVYSSSHMADFILDPLPLSSTEVRLFKLGVRMAHRIIVQTDEQARLCRQRFNRASLVIKSIVEPASPRVGAPEAFLWIGRLVDYKRPDAFLKLARALPEARFRLVGVPAGQPHIERAVERGARELGNVELLPPRTRSEVLCLYDHAVAIVSTSISEGMPNVFLEGWSRGVPSLTLSHDPDGVIETNRLGGCAHDSLAELVSLAREMWLTRDDQAAVSARCREYVRRE